MKKGVISALIAASILAVSAMSSVSFAADALSDEVLPEVETVDPRYAIRADTYTDLSIKSGKATCYSYIEAEDVNKIIGTQILQKKGSLNQWSEILGANWTNIAHTDHMSMSHTQSSLTSGTYRIKTVFKLTANDGTTETITIYSSEVKI